MDNIKEQFEKLDRLEHCIAYERWGGSGMWSTMKPVPDGEYVRYDDVMALVNELIASSKKELNHERI